jgi:hypothetical protein
MTGTVHVKKSQKKSNTTSSAAASSSSFVRLNRSVFDQAERFFGKGTLVHNTASFGNNFHCGSDCVFGRNFVAGDDCVLGDNVLAHNDVIFGAKVRVGEGVVFGAGAAVGSFAHIAPQHTVPATTAIPSCEILYDRGNERKFESMNGADWYHETAKMADWIRRLDLSEKMSWYITGWRYATPRELESLFQIGVVWLSSALSTRGGRLQHDYFGIRFADVVSRALQRGNVEVARAILKDLVRGRGECLEELEQLRLLSGAS